MKTAKRGNKSYDDIKRAEILLLLIKNNLNYSKTMRITGVAINTLKSWANSEMGKSIIEKSKKYKNEEEILEESAKNMAEKELAKELTLKKIKLENDILTNIDEEKVIKYNEDFIAKATISRKELIEKISDLIPKEKNLKVLGEVLKIIHDILTQSGNEIYDEKIGDWSEIINNLTQINIQNANIVSTNNRD